MTGENLQIKRVQTAPFRDQKPGTSGLRKKVNVFQQLHYTENFIQAILSAIPSKGAQGATLVVGGDGRYFCKEATQLIISICAGNGVKKLIVGREGIFSTPAVSNMIRKHSATGGIILTASHNPGGPDADFGIKYNSDNGGPAVESITQSIFEHSLKLTSYLQLADAPKLDLSKIGSYPFGDMSVEIVDSVTDYVLMVKDIFDFGMIKAFVQSRPDFTLLFDGMHGVTGPYGSRIFIDELGFPASSVMNAIPLTDFGGGHPDPNLTYAHELVKCVNKSKISFAAASDGDGDRNMIIAHDAFVNPSDSVAVIAANSQCIPYFRKTGIRGLGRSMPTSLALDRVAEKFNYKMSEVPTGWKFFGNLMDAGQLSICGEESFGTGSDHIREKDGLWAVLCWLSILADKGQTDKNVSVKSVLQEHYATFGRNFFTRYDYEEVDSAAGDKLMAGLMKHVSDNSLVGKVYEGFTILKCDNYEYTDPIDHSVSKNQGIRITFTDTSRIIFRLSGTGSSGATVRLYIERYVKDKEQFELDAQAVLADFVKVALDISRLIELTGRKKPTVIT